MKKYDEKLWAEALSKNSCPYGCVVTTSICEHLENILPKEETGSVYWGPEKQKAMRIIYTDDLDKFSKYARDMFEDLNDQELFDFVQKLYSWGLNRNTVDVMTDRFVLNKTFNEISNERGYNNIVAVHRLYKRGLEQIRNAIETNESGAV